MLRVWPRFHVTGTGSDVTGTGSHMTRTGSDRTGSHVTGSGGDRKCGGHVISGGKPLTSWKNGWRAQGTGSYVIWSGKPLKSREKVMAGSESKVQISHRGRVLTGKKDAMLEKMIFYCRLVVTKSRNRRPCGGLDPRSMLC